MDQITIDLTDLDPPGGAGSRRWTGVLVELISPDPAAPNHLPALAAAAGTIPHEIMCRLSPRIPRIYTAGPARGVGGWGSRVRASETDVMAAS